MDSCDSDSDYSSNEDSPPTSSFPNVAISPAHLAFLNESLAKVSTEEVLKWCLISLPGLYQSTSMGISGLVILDLLESLRQPHHPHPVPVIFVDTLYHCSETMELQKKISTRSTSKMHIYKPKECQNVEDFEKYYGKELWIKDNEKYEYLTKVEPLKRAYEELKVQAIICGRRNGQSGSKNKLIPIIEVDETGLIRVNPLANWCYEEVWFHILRHNIPYNSLLDKGYRSIGDWHSTSTNKDANNYKRKTKRKTTAELENSSYMDIMTARHLEEKD